MIKEFAKTILPKPIWRAFRRRKIIAGQNTAASICDKYIELYFNGADSMFHSKKRDDLDGKKIIWQYWAQGFDDKLPEVVKECLDSVDRYKGDYEIIRLSDDTIPEYVELPDYVWQKRNDSFSTSVFSDVLRLSLLYLYGGVWLDATVLMTGGIPEKYSNHDFFMFRRDESELYKRYWENSYAYYFGWGNDFKVRVLTSIAFAKAGSPFLKDFLNSLLLIWKEEEHYPYYFTTQILFNQLIASGKTELDSPVESDCGPHKLMQLINDAKAPFTYDDIIKENALHKLSYKGLDLDRFHSLITNGN